MGNRRVYIGNTPYTATRADFESFFAPRKVTDVKIVTDRETGRPRGFAFVELERAEDALEAVKNLDGTEMGGRTVKVAIANDKPSGGDRRNGGGGGGGRQREQDGGSRRRDGDRRNNRRDEDFNDSWK